MQMVLYRPQDRCSVLSITFLLDLSVTFITFFLVSVMEWLWFEEGFPSGNVCKWNKYISPSSWMEMFDAKLYEDVSSIKREGRHSDTTTKENFLYCHFHSTLSPLKIPSSNNSKLKHPKTNDNIYCIISTQ